MRHRTRVAAAGAAAGAAAARSQGARLRRVLTVKGPTSVKLVSDPNRKRICEIDSFRTISCEFDKLNYPIYEQRLDNNY